MAVLATLMLTFEIFIEQPRFVFRQETRENDNK